MTSRSRRESGPQREYRVDTATGEKIPTGRWWFVIDAGMGEDGKRKQARRRGFPSKKVAQQKLDKLRVKVAERTYVAPKRQTFRSFVLDDCLPAVRVKLEPSTRRATPATSSSTFCPCWVAYNLPTWAATI